jgi:hypothetical protein
MVATNWTEQIDTSWEKEQCLLIEEMALIEEAELFDYLCNLRVEWVTTKKSTPVVHFATTKGEIQVEELAFPRSSDDSFKGYQSRVSHDYNSLTTLLYVRNASPLSRHLRDKVEKVLAPIWISGRRWNRLEIEVYVGRYSWTAIGIHRERCANIHHVVSGNKEMLSWPPRALEANPLRSDVALGGSSEEAASAGLLIRPDCTKTVARRGQAIYIPSKHWHVGVSDNFSVAVNLALYGV